MRMRCKILVFVALFGGALLAESSDVSQDSSSYVQEKSQEFQPYKPKVFEWRLGLYYDINFTSFSNKKINYHNSSVSGFEIKAGFLVRASRRVSVELSAGVGAQTTRFMHNGKPNTIDPADMAYIESLFQGAFLEEIKNAMLSGDLSNVWDAFDWSKLNYDYQRNASFDERISSYTLPFEARLNYALNNDWLLYLGGVYHKGGLIDDGRIFVGTSYKYFDVRLGYVAYISDRFKGAEYARVAKDGGAPISLTIGAVF